MSAITIELPEHLAAELAASKIPAERLNALLVGTLEAWLRRRETTARGGEARPWAGAFEDSAVTFVDQLIADNQDLFDELARR